MKYIFKFIMAWIEVVVILFSTKKIMLTLVTLLCTCLDLKMQQQKMVKSSGLTRGMGQPLLVVQLCYFLAKNHMTTAGL